MLTKKVFSEIAYLRSEFNKDTLYLSLPDGACGIVATIFGDALKKAEILKSKEQRLMKIEILKVITGLLKIQSSKNLMGHTIKVLIDELGEYHDRLWYTSTRGEKLVVPIARAIKSGASAEEICASYRLWMETHLRNMQSGDNRSSRSPRSSDN